MPTWIRRATLTDADAVRAIIASSYIDGGFADPESSPDYVRQLLDAESRIEAADVFVADVEGKTVGTITVAAPGSEYANLAGPGELEIRMLGVLPEARHRGVATALVKACEELAYRSGATRVVLCTEPAMTAAQSLYAAIGYRRSPDRDWTIGGTTLMTFSREVAD